VSVDQPWDCQQPIPLDLLELLARIGRGIDNQSVLDPQASAL
jgi:hypothetical protein